MDQNDDVRLRDLLKEWKAPETPVSLERRVLVQRGSGWHFLLRGYIRVPVPIACAVVLLFAGGVWRSAWLGEKMASCVAAVTHDGSQIAFCPFNSKC